MADSRATSMIFGCLQPMMVCIRWSLSVANRDSGLERAHIPRNEDVPEKTTRFHVTLALESTRLWLPFVPVLSNIRRFRLSPLVRKPLQCLAAFVSTKIDKCWEQHVQSTIVSVNNYGNDIQSESWHFLITLYLRFTTRTTTASVGKSGCLFSPLSLPLLSLLLLWSGSNGHHAKPHKQHLGSRMERPRRYVTISRHAPDHAGNHFIHLEPCWALSHLRRMWLLLTLRQPKSYPKHSPSLFICVYVSQIEFWVARIRRWIG